MQNIQARALRSVLKDLASSNRWSKCGIDSFRIFSLKAIEIHERLNDMSQEYLSSFSESSVHILYVIMIKLKMRKTTFGRKSFFYNGALVLNSLSIGIRAVTLEDFKTLIKNWQGPPCHCPVYQLNISWWRHQMEAFTALLAICAGNSPVTGEFPAQRPVTRGFDIFVHLRPNIRLSKQPWGWLFETLSRPLWRHRNGDWFWFLIKRPSRANYQRDLRVQEPNWKLIGF